MTVDDQPVFREVAAAVIAATPGFELAGEASSGPEALKGVSSHEPDLVLLDVRMPGMDGIEAARQIAELATGAVVVLISLDDAATIVSEAEDAKAVALVRKQDFGPALLQRLWESYGREVRPRAV